MCVVSLGGLPWRGHGVPLPGEDGVLGCGPHPAGVVLSTLLLNQLVHTVSSILWIISLVIVALLDPGPPDLGHGQTAGQAALLRFRCSSPIGLPPAVTPKH